MLYFGAKLLFFIYFVHKKLLKVLSFGVYLYLAVVKYIVTLMRCLV